MNHQEWFEQFRVKLLNEVVLEETAAQDFLHGQIWIREQWSIARLALIKMALHMLPSLERRIIRLIFFEDFSEREVAQKLKVPRSKVHRVKLEALKKLSKSSFIKLAMYPRQTESGSRKFSQYLKQK